MNLFYVNYKDTYFYVISNLKSRFFFVFIFYHPDIDEPDIDEPDIDEPLTLLSNLCINPRHCFITTQWEPILQN
jgi:hypothetical protein